MSYQTENAILTLAYGLISLVRNFSFEKTARALVPSIAFAYVLGNYAGDFYHKARHTLEEHLSL